MAATTAMQTSAAFGQLRDRLAAAQAGRLTDVVRVVLDHAFAAIEAAQVTAEELDTLIRFLTEVGEATDARRQEWVLLADVLGLSAHLCDRDGGGSAATPPVLRGPFYRADAPRLPQGANLSRDGLGTPVAVGLSLTDTEGRPVPGAEVEVWHANAQGRYENQDPDAQPEHNLRGRFRADDEGRLAFRTIRPRGYRLPDDGPVGRLAQAVGLSLDRPAHIHFAVSAAGLRPLTTAIFDRADPMIGRDALYSVKPDLLGEFRPVPGGLQLEARLVLTRLPAPPLAKG